MFIIKFSLFPAKLANEISLGLVYCILLNLCNYSKSVSCSSSLRSAARLPWFEPLIAENTYRTASRCAVIDSVQVPNPGFSLAVPFDDREFGSDSDYRCSKSNCPRGTLGRN